MQVRDARTSPQIEQGYPCSRRRLPNDIPLRFLATPSTTTHFTLTTTHQDAHKTERTTNRRGAERQRAEASADSHQASSSRASHFEHRWRNGIMAYFPTACAVVRITTSAIATRQTTSTQPATASRASDCNKKLTRELTTKSNTKSILITPTTNRQGRDPRRATTFAHHPAPPPSENGHAYPTTHDTAQLRFYGRSGTAHPCRAPSDRSKCAAAARDSRPYRLREQPGCDCAAGHRGHIAPTEEASGGGPHQIEGCQDCGNGETVGIREGSHERWSESRACKDGGR